MIANLTYSPLFYITIPLLYFVLSFSTSGPPSDIFEWSLRSLFAFLIMVFSTLLESFLKTPIRHPNARKAWIVVLLILTPFLPQSSDQLSLSLGLLCLMGFVWSVRRYFYQKQGYLLFPLAWAVPLGFLSSFLYPFLLVYILPLFRKDREGTYLVFSSLTIPLLFTLVYQLQNNPNFTTQFVSDYLPFLRDGLLLTVPNAVQSIFECLKEPSLLFCILYVLYSLNSDPGKEEELNFRKALLVFLPFYCLFIGFQPAYFSTYPVFLVLLYFLEREGPRLELLELKQQNKGKHFYRLILLLLLLFPFYERSLERLGQETVIRPGVDQNVTP